MSSTNRALTVGVAGDFAPAAAAGVVVAGGTDGDSAAPEVLAAAVGEPLSSGGLEGTKEVESQPGNTASAAITRTKHGAGRMPRRRGLFRLLSQPAVLMSIALQFSSIKVPLRLLQASLVVFHHAAIILSSTRPGAQDDINASSPMDSLPLDAITHLRTMMLPDRKARGWRDGQVPGSRPFPSSLHRFGKTSWRAVGFAFWPSTWTGRYSIPRALCVPGRRRPLPGPPGLAFARCSARGAANVVPGPSRPSLH